MYIKKYRVNESELFNLESMYEHLMVMIEQMEGGEREWDDTLFTRVEELENLLDKTNGIGSLVDWPTLKRIREIQAERQFIRYNRCLAAGMSEKDAGECFSI